MLVLVHRRSDGFAYRSTGSLDGPRTDRIDGYWVSDRVYQSVIWQLSPRVSSPFIPRIPSNQPSPRVRTTLLFLPVESWWGVIRVALLPLDTANIIY